MSAHKALLGRKGKNTQILSRSNTDSTQQNYTKKQHKPREAEQQQQQQQQGRGSEFCTTRRRKERGKKHNTTQFKRGKEKWNCKTISPHQRGSELQSDSDACAGWMRENASWVDE
jgi:hypothetical protein